MSKSSDLARSPSADVVAVGTALVVLGLVLDGVGLRLAISPDDELGGGGVLVVGTLVLLLGLVCLGVGLFRIAEKVDDTHRIVVLRHERDEAARLAERRSAERDGEAAPGVVGRVGLEPTTDG